MKRVNLVGLVAAALVATPLAAQGQLILATTTSVRDAGLLDTLLPPFEQETGITVRVIAVGSGQAMALGRRGEADIMILHDPPNEERFMADGFGIDRRYLMHNEFVLVGPPGDPAHVKGHPVADAFRLIAAARAPFVTRGDHSGTNQKEIAVWAAASITPSGDWYRETGQGMGATLQIADQTGAYTLTDIGTWLNNKAPFSLEVVAQGDSILVNPYHVIRVNPERFPRINQADALRLANYLTGREAHDIIATYGIPRFGRPLFTPADAARGP